MTSRFLSGEGTDLTALQDGTFALSVASAAVVDLAPGLPVRTGPDRSLTSGLISAADCSFTPITNPATSDIDLNGRDLGGIREAVFQANPTPAYVAAGDLGLYNNAGRLNYISDTVSHPIASTDDLGSYLARAGGTMTGAINMWSRNHGSDRPRIAELYPRLGRFRKHSPLLE